MSPTIGGMERYEVRIVGSIGPRRAASLGCTARRLSSGDSLLAFDAIDQAALYGLLSRLRDLGLELVGVERRVCAPSSCAETEEARDGDR